MDTMHFEGSGRHVSLRTLSGDERVLLMTRLCTHKVSAESYAISDRNLSLRSMAASMKEVPPFLCQMDPG